VIIVTPLLSVTADEIVQLPTNQLPTFQGGMDRGVLRRLMVITFNRTIPEAERIAHIGQLIVTQEADLLLAWAVDGASRLLRRGFYPELDSSREALSEWSQSADPVLGWIEDRVIVVKGQEAPRIASKDLYTNFRSWAEVQGYNPNRLPNVNNFVQRSKAALKAKGVEYKRSGNFRGFVGIELLKANVVWLEPVNDREDAA
jgi:phage/plasmid-associated DNA primase